MTSLDGIESDEVPEESVEPADTIVSEPIEQAETEAEITLKS